MNPQNASSTVVKTVTIVVFITLLAGLVAFKSGVFNRYLNTEAAQQTPEQQTASEPVAEPAKLEIISSESVAQPANLKTTSPDTVPKVVWDSLKYGTIMVSSKSFVMVDQQEFLEVDTRFIRDFFKKDSLKIAP